MKARRWFLEASYSALKRTSCLHVANLLLDRANILMYHRVNDYDKDPLTTPTAIFEQMLVEISRRYEVVSVKSLLRSIANRESLRGKVAITFDDGYKDNFTCAAPILKRYNIPATFFVTTGYLNTDRVFPWDTNNPISNPAMAWDEVVELDKMGFEIGAHTVNHVNLGVVSRDVARREIRGAKEHIEARLGKKVESFAFPFGRRENCRPEVSDVVKEEGYSCCMTGYGGKVSVNSDPFCLYRIPMYPNTIELLMELDNFVTYFDGCTKIGGVPLIHHNFS